ncbi:hypothetical protein [Deltalipothrixvirus pozzuoliense]|uniref:Uncharacterized protein ORF180 n=1 Tax=Acidianus filamentous virus 2 (isolate Italy/Pozzuoli) TaxID=654910 RepID=Y180_AFV2P|nr:hypothetical protein AFV2_gp30 [Acidianus filamentous virus 2]Q573D9.1 RecName: Full=Uncharacterized protein ORF180 [Acidianus filamentous virus 2 (isolate Pozzuoli)]CAH69417.1 hypothetical protein [Acidianus filamentous virus 2]
MADKITLWTDLVSELRKKLTKKEMATLQEIIDENGSIEDVIVTLVRKAVNPDLLSISDIELCMQKAIKIGAYVTATGGGSPRSNDNMPSQIAREVVEEAYGGSPEQQQQQNPLQNMMKQMADAISTAIMSEVSSKLKSVMPVPMPQQNSDNGSTPHIVDSSKSKDKSSNDGDNGVFTGDE